MKVLAPRLDASPAGRQRLPNLSAAPSSPALGEMYFDTGTNLAYVCTNAVTPVWSSIIDTTGAGGGSLDWKDSVRVATTGAETFTISAGSVTGIAGVTIDGVSLSIGDRVLIKDAPAATGVGSANSLQPGNGIYSVTGNTTNLTVARTTDADVAGELTAATTVVVEGGGTANKSSTWTIVDPASGSITPGTTSVQWSTKQPRELGVVGAPSYSFLGDLNTGMFSSAADTIDWATGGARTMTLSVFGLVNRTNAFSSDPGGSSLNTTVNITARDGAGAVVAGNIVQNFSGLMTIQPPASGTLSLYSGGSARLVIDASGNVAIVGGVGFNNKTPAAPPTYKASIGSQVVFGAAGAGVTFGANGVGFTFVNDDLTVASPSLRTLKVSDTNVTLVAQVLYTLIHDLQNMGILN